MELAGDPEAVTRDEDAIEHDGLATALNDTRSDSKAGTPDGQPSARASRGPRRTADTASWAWVTTMPSLNSSTWPSDVSVRSDVRTSSPMRAGRNERCRLIGRPSTSRRRSSATTRARSVRPERGGHAAVGGGRSASSTRVVTCLALGREVAGEALQLQDLVVDGGRGHERAEPVTPRDQTVALEHFEGLAQGHERDAEVVREPALVGQRRARRPLAVADAPAKGLGDAVVARHASVHSTPLSVF